MMLGHLYSRVSTHFKQADLIKKHFCQSLSRTPEFQRSRKELLASNYQSAQLSLINILKWLPFSQEPLEVIQFSSKSIFVYVYYSELQPLIYIRNHNIRLIHCKLAKGTHNFKWDQQIHQHVLTMFKQIHLIDGEIWRILHLISKILPQSSLNQSETIQLINTGLIQTFNPIFGTFDSLIPTCPENWQATWNRTCQKQNTMTQSQSPFSQTQQFNNPINGICLWLYFWKYRLSAQQKVFNQQLLKHYQKTNVHKNNNQENKSNLMLFSCPNMIVHPLLISASQLLRNQLYMQAQGLLNYVQSTNNIVNNNNLPSIQFCNLLMSGLYKQVRRNSQADNLHKEYAKTFDPRGYLLFYLTTK